MSDTQPSGRPKTAPGFHHIALRAFDFEAPRRFYQDGLGFVRAYGWGEGDSRAAMLDTGDGNYLAHSHIEPKDVTLAGDYPVPVGLAFVRGLDGEVIEFFQNDTL